MVNGSQAKAGDKTLASMMFITLQQTTVIRLTEKREPSTQTDTPLTHSLTHKQQRAKPFQSNNVPPPSPLLFTEALWDSEFILLLRSKPLTVYTCRHETT